jgi:pimeloyl-ACP methyl ester carboxylesterase
MSTPTVVLVHGAFAESASWNGVIARLADHGVRSMAPPNELRSVAGDAANLTAVLRSIDGPVLLVGHSYGGAVMTNAVGAGSNVRGLVYLAGFAPDTGENIGELSARLPGSTLGENVYAVPLPDGSNDLYIKQDHYHQQFCADVDDATALLMSVTQRPLRDVALNDASGEPAWRGLPSWFLIPELDRNIPAAVHHLMADRAGAVDTIEVAGSAHAIPVSHPDEAADLIRAAIKHVTD